MFSLPPEPIKEANHQPKENTVKCTEAENGPPSLVLQTTTNRLHDLEKSLGLSLPLL